MRRIYLITTAILSLSIATACSDTANVATANYDTAWQPDILGDGYEMRYVNMPDDYSGEVRSTIVRKLSDCDTHKAILYVHGYNDYFFQKEMGDRFVDSCYNFYAVDLRKYGRSLLPQQRKFDTRDMREYFADIDSALAQIVADGNTQITLMGHSTGGLTTSYYLNEHHGSTVYPIRGLILNSPFLDWRLSKSQEKYLVPLVTALSPILKNIDIDQGGSGAYAHTLLAKYDGEWEYNTDWKMEISPNVTIGWIAAIERAQNTIQSPDSDVATPVLLLHSDKSSSREFRDRSRCDAVLDVDDISKYGKQLSSQGVTEIVEVDALHDIVLSRLDVREKAYNDIFNWLKSI